MKTSVTDGEKGPLHNIRQNRVVTHVEDSLNRIRSNKVISHMEESVGHFLSMDKSLMDEFQLQTVPADWSPIRRHLHDLMGKAECFVGFIVLLNFVFIIMETDINVDGQRTPEWLQIANSCFVIFYSLEISTRFYVQRSLFWRFGSNIFDLFIVLVAIIGEALSSSDVDNLGMMRTFRLLRVLRAIRVMESFRELWFLVRDAVACARTLFWAFILLLLLLSMWSVFAVELLQPRAQELDCESCSSAYSSVMQANLTFFGLVTYGEGWEDLALPLINKHPWTAVIFLGVTFSMMFGFLNIVLATMVENAAHGRQADVAEVAKSRATSRAKEEQDLLRICSKLDTDSNELISLEEMIAAIDTVPEFRDILRTMDVGVEEMECIFNIIDADQSGSVSYSEFANHLWKLRNAERTPLLMMVKHYVTMIWASIQNCNHQIADELQTLPSPVKRATSSRAFRSISCQTNDLFTTYSSEQIYSLPSKAKCSHAEDMLAADTTHEQLNLSTAAMVKNSSNQRVEKVVHSVQRETAGMKRNEISQHGRQSNLQLQHVREGMPKAAKDPAGAGQDLRGTASAHNMQQIYEDALQRQQMTSEKFQHGLSPASPTSPSLALPSLSAQSLSPLHLRRSLHSVRSPQARIDDVNHSSPTRSNASFPQGKFDRNQFAETMGKIDALLQHEQQDGNVWEAA
eukprot:gnl/MRDRNA2_/MRDRNA2_125337_c0_seq1.p1 gnl/MRDRNA2_/MRDRNA2_125337_c0~~gnl/MRDRNA2_/MRDRNA2_125337_c0_seq1.p1  ORF type:complete len:685 (-),score=103.36 gnl/MRDRNA2_/MRDRNA2_125337_c0_seq1:127-2181(-)